MAMLYEAVACETIHPEPLLLFDYFPIHSRIRELARDHFKNGKYVAAVFEAAKALNELIQQRTGIDSCSEVRLVNKSMLGMDQDYGKPDFSQVMIQFNDFVNDVTGKHEQEGLALICKGIFKAFRNPKGHKPEDNELVQLEPY